MDVHGRLGHHHRARRRAGPLARAVVDRTALTDLGLGAEIAGTFGPLKNAEGEPDAQVAGLDVESVTDVTGVASTATSTSRRRPV